MSIELLSPAGNYEKLCTALAYGADAAYMGLTKFSLRKNAGNILPQEIEKIRAIKAQSGKKLYCTMNILFSEDQIREAESMIGGLEESPFDAFIISDIGLVPLFQKLAPSKQLHLSTQASCLNSSAARMYYDMGFSRVILGREATLDDIKRIKDKVPELELEAFVHGAMCMSYSGRCLLSSYLAGRSANQGDCSHTCRWRYKLYALEEEERRGEYFPISQDDEGYTTILSSKDLCMIDHLDDLVDAGLSSLKIEGRMKSVYYVALVTRAYRKMLDHDKERELYRDELFNVSHREFSTAFFYGRDRMEDDKISSHTSYGYRREYLFLGSVLDKVDEGKYVIDVRNQIRCGRKIEYIGPDLLSLEDGSFRLADEEGKEIEKLDHGKKGFLLTDKELEKGYILRSEAEIKEIT